MLVTFWLVGHPWGPQDEDFKINVIAIMIVKMKKDFLVIRERFGQKCAELDIGDHHKFKEQNDHINQIHNLLQTINFDRLNVLNRLSTENNEFIVWIIKNSKFLWFHGYADIGNFMLLKQKLH